jgi:UDP-N-acetylglucosamine diphosphorylase/glucosamine-1-phosphate N-acetyltransferase
MQLVLFDAGRASLYPFTYTRPIADIRCGILTARERWEKLLQFQTSFTLTEQYLQGCYPLPPQDNEYLLVNGQVIGTQQLAQAIRDLPAGAALYAEETLVAARMSYLPAAEQLDTIPTTPERRMFEGKAELLSHPWDIFSKNDWAIRLDYPLLTAGRNSAALPADVVVRGTDIFIEEDAVIWPGTIINAATGPVYIGRKAEIMEGCMVRGPFALGNHAVLKMGAKVYSGTTIGPGCKVGGEISNAVFFANSNKGHDGFLGNAVIGEWCNLGADTNCSNLKNNYDEVKVWDEATHKSVKTGLTFCGLLMGDHSKCGINTMFNTGTIVGVSCNIWGGGFPEKFIPSFSWGGPEGMSTYQFPRAMETAERMMARRNKALMNEEMRMLEHVYETTAASRSLLLFK